MKWIFVFLIALVSGAVNAQSYSTENRPKLVVGIVVDQMRQEYLYRFSPKFGNDGFKRLMNDGFMLKNAHYNYAPTYTGPGHASVYTGTTPAIHGIIGNDFYDKETKGMVNCVGDPLHKPVGAETKNGAVSPWRMLTTTITDELKIATQKRAKVIGISFKDRGAALPAGHMADAAYWYDNVTGRFISSTYYMKTLTPWVQHFNNLNLADKYLSQDWNTLLPIDQYTESGPDDSPYEKRFESKTKPTFPYSLKTLQKNIKGYELLPYTPFANDYLTEFAKATLANEQLGKRNGITDFFCISYSSTDIIGHQTGPQSIEVQDMYLRLDKNIASLLKTLDEVVGVNNYTVFLTSDHGVAEVPQFLTDNKVPSGYFNPAYSTVALTEFLNSYFPGKQLIEKAEGEQIFLNHEAFQGAPKTSGLDLFIVAELVGKFLMTQPGVVNYYTEGVLRQGRFDEQGLKGMIIRGYHPKRSGDVLIALSPGWIPAVSVQGTTHGSTYPYDTHVPILFYGKGIKKGSTVKYYPITSIAPTLSMLLNISLPNGCTGQPVEELFE